MFIIFTPSDGYGVKSGSKNSIILPKLEANYHGVDIGMKLDLNSRTNSGLVDLGEGVVTSIDSFRIEGDRMFLNKEKLPSFGKGWLDHDFAKEHGFDTFGALVDFVEFSYGLPFEGTVINFERIVN